MGVISMSLSFLSWAELKCLRSAGVSLQENTRLTTKRRSLRPEKWVVHN